MSFLFRSAVALALVASGSVVARASSIIYNANCSGTNTTNDFQQSGTPGQIVTASIPGQCAASASADFSVIKLDTATTEVGPFQPNQGVASAQLEVQFYLTNPSLPANTFIPDPSIRIAFDVIINAAPGGSGGGRPGDVTFSGFDVRRTNDQVALFRIGSTSDVFGGNVCPSPLATYPQCNGHYTGFVDVPLTDPTRVNSSGPGGIGPNTLRLSVHVQSNNSALTDAAHTVFFSGTTLPADTTVSYTDLSGNPLGLNAASTAVPEPGTVLPGLAGLAVILGLRGRWFRRRVQLQSGRSV